MSQSPQQPRGDDPSPPPAGLCDRYFISALGSRGANGLPKALKPHNDLSTWEIYFAICICKKRGSKTRVVLLLLAPVHNSSPIAFKGLGWPVTYPQIKYFHLWADE